MRFMPTLFALLASCGLSVSDEPTPETSVSETSVSDRFFERLDKNSDGKLTLAEAPEQGQMLVEFLLH